MMVDAGNSHSISICKLHAIQTFKHYIQGLQLKTALYNIAAAELL